MSAQFEKGNLLSETCYNAESGSKYDDDFTMPQLISEDKIDAMDSGDESDDEHMSTEMLEDIRDVSQSHPSVNRREACYKIRDHIKQSQVEWKGAVLSTRNMGKGLHKVFKAVVNEILQVLPILGESGSEFSYFILDLRNFSEVTRLSDDIKNLAKRNSEGD